MEARPAIDPRLALAGAELLALIREWPAWTHRRVEHVTFLEEDLVRRRISVDLSVSGRAPRAWGVLGADDARLLPLGLLRKGRLAQFDLRQEGGEAVALLSSTQNGPLSTEVLMAAAQLVGAGAGVQGAHGGDPGGLRASLRTIATGDPAPAVEAWRALGVTSRADDPEAPWREALAADGWFMELALNLAHNFLVLASVPADAGERRVLKLSYVRRLGAEAPRPRVAGVYAVRAASATVARLAVTAAISVPGAARPRPLPRVTARVVALPEGRTVAWLATDRDGEAVATLAPGRHCVEAIDAPGGARLAGGVPEITLAPGASGTVALAFEPAPGRAPRARLPRAVAPLAATRLALPVPGLRFCASAHLELEAPDGLRVTRAELHELHRPTDQPERRGAARVDIVTEPVQRAHLYLARTGRDRTGSCEVWLRPRPGTILAPAALVAAVATVLLGLVAWRLDELTATVGSTGSLLLFVPGIASAYVARPREDPFTSRALLALRGWALVPAVACLTAAATLLLARPTVLVHGVPAIGEPSAAARPLLVATAAMAAVSFAVLALTWRAATWPPEAPEGAAVPATM